MFGKGFETLQNPFLINILQVSMRVYGLAKWIVLPIVFGNLEGYDSDPRQTMHYVKKISAKTHCWHTTNTTLTMNKMFIGSTPL